MSEFVLTPTNRQQLIDKILSLDVTRLWNVTVVERKKKRSSEQNKRYWKLLTEFGKHLGYTPDEMHDICRFKFLRNAIEIEGERLPLLATTTKLTSAEMVEYQDMIERWGHGMGFVFDDA